MASILYFSGHSCPVFFPGSSSQGLPHLFLQSTPGLLRTWPSHPGLVPDLFSPLLSGHIRLLAATYWWPPGVSVMQSAPWFPACIFTCSLGSSTRHLIHISNLTGRNKAPDCPLKPAPSLTVPPSGSLSNYDEQARNSGIIFQSFFSMPQASCLSAFPVKMYPGSHLIHHLLSCCLAPSHLHLSWIIALAS